ncbi:hypothetical protein [Streptomyces sp. G45]|uniref:hypothetical protein n=1 Tax=Streptomyces sp. G45 TaxID=3406627 RepID=UPI003C215D31
MIVLALVAVLLLAVFGCVCVVWAQRGGPRWVRAVSAVTLALGTVVRRQGKGQRTGSGQTLDGGD